MLVDHPGLLEDLYQSADQGPKYGRASLNWRLHELDKCFSLAWPSQRETPDELQSGVEEAVHLPGAIR